jgi:hypothetical protein
MSLQTLCCCLLAHMTEAGRCKADPELSLEVSALHFLFGNQGLETHWSDTFDWPSPPYPRGPEYNACTETWR